tara:strand:- start:167 stop:469 length:303 start_codon:yes stop_codon:yes gene_type:complete
MLFWKKLTCVITTIFYCNVSLATCLNADGLVFTKIAQTDFLVAKEGKNIAILTIEFFDRNNIKVKNTWVFFTDKICSYGANSYFMLNGVKTKIDTIKIFQ